VVDSQSENVRKRVLRLLRLDRQYRPNPLSSEVIPALLRAGRPALIGGAIRDIARGGRAAFKSDLDFVVYGSRPTEFRETMRAAGAIENKFGGFGLQIGVWHIDAWHLQDTWARTAGLRDVHSLHDLLQCTFFDWDAIIFDLETRKLISKRGYFSKLSSGILDITLEPNPNPQGSLVRSLRRAALWHIDFGPKLTSFALNSLEQFNWPELVQLDRRAFDYPVLSNLNLSSLKCALRNPKRKGRILTSTPVPRSQIQLDLPICGDDRTSLVEGGI
jgi:hypothetical protein